MVIFKLMIDVFGAMQGLACQTGEFMLERPQTLGKHASNGHPRGQFTPAKHYNAVFLCGGGSPATSSIEVYTGDTIEELKLQHRLHYRHW